MPRKQSRSFTEVELKFMRILWEKEPMSPDNIGKILAGDEQAISVGSIRNVLAIMMRKGYVIRKKAGKAYLYSAKIEKDQAQGTLLGDMLSDMFDGSAALMVAALFESKQIPDNDLDTISQLIEKHKREEDGK